ncbi:MAG: HNH endonuclease signature motif containing protein [Candidatus Woesebacteria bacterium]|nr:HNH endonuclease signature motif containing protein [Candidatus Woesebacteria bacterium]
MELSNKNCEHLIVEYKNRSEVWCTNCNNRVYLNVNTNPLWTTIVSLPSQFKLIHKPNPKAMQDLILQEYIKDRIKNKILPERNFPHLKGKACCQRCGSTKTSIQFHHIIPKSLGGDNSQDNLLAVCSSCHDIEDALSFIIYGQGLTVIRWLRRLNKLAIERRIELDF